MATVTVSAVEASGGAARVQVTVVGSALGDTMTVERIQDGTAWPILGATDLPAESTIVDDVELPLNQPVSWRATLSTGESSDSAPLTIQSDWCILSNPYTGRWVNCVILDMEDQEAPQRGKALDIEETAQVVYVYDVDSAWRRSLTLLTLTLDDRDELLAMAATGAPLLLRAMCPRHEVGWFGRDGGSRSNGPLAKYSLTDPRWRHGFTSIVPVPVPNPDERAQGDTLGDLHTVVPTTLGDIAARWATLGAIAAADLRGE